MNGFSAADFSNCDELMNFTVIKNFFYELLHEIQSLLLTLAKNGSSAVCRILWYPILSMIPVKITIPVTPLRDIPAQIWTYKDYIL